MSFITMIVAVGHKTEYRIERKALFTNTSEVLDVTLK